MNFPLSSFWGGVLTVSFYQLVFTNPVSFLSLGLGVVIGFCLTLYIVGDLAVRGYISATQQMARVVVEALDNNPMLASIFRTYINSTFNTLFPKHWSPPPSSFPTCSPVSPPTCSPAAPNLNIGDILNLMNSFRPDEQTENNNISRTDETVLPEDTQDEVSIVTPNEEPEPRTLEKSENRDREESETLVKEECHASPRKSSRREDRRDEVKPATPNRTV